MTPSRLLAKHGACAEACEWAKKYKSIPAAWAACPRGDWLLWIAAKEQWATRQQLVLASCECARLALPHVPAGEKRPLAAIETAERWARGETTLAEVRTAYAYAANAAYAAYAAYAAAAAAAAAYAAAAAAYADAARKKVLAECADIVRRRASEEGWAPRTRRTRA